MTVFQSEMLAREWVELREENQPGRIVLRPASHNLPPARGRRRLDLRVPGHAVAKTPGATDRLETRDGSWVNTDDELTVDVPGWKGRYRIDELTDDKLVLCPK